jgi:predicted DNA-binding transcriptional regulator YafY
MKNYDPILTRLMIILSKLNQNELPNTKELADEFNVTQRTIQNDIYKRLSPNFPIVKNSSNRFQFEEGYNLGCYLDYKVTTQYKIQR